VSTRAFWVIAAICTAIAVGFVVWALLSDDLQGIPGLGSFVFGVAAVVLAMWNSVHKPERARPIDPPEPHAAPDLPTSRPTLHMGDWGAFFSDDRRATVQYIDQMLALPCGQRVVDVELHDLSDSDREQISASVADFETCASQMLQRRVTYVHPPHREWLGVALRSLWGTWGSRGPGWATVPGMALWYAWPPTDFGARVPFYIPRDDEAVKLVLPEFDGRPIHVQRLDPRLVWEWLVPAVIRAAVEAPAKFGPTPILLDNWRIADTDPNELDNRSPRSSTRPIARSEGTALTW
jgi:hypothetical protein